MKIAKGILLVVVVSFLVGATATVFAASKAEWPKQEGEICLKLCGTDDCDGAYDPLGTVSMYVMKMGKGHYLVLGRNVDRLDQIVPFIGSAEIVQLTDGPKVRMHVTLSLTDTDSFTGQMITVMLDPGTLIGTVEGLNVDVEKIGGVSGVVSYFGGLYARPCP